MVIPKAKCRQSLLKVRCVVDRQFVDAVFECPEKTFDATVFPWAVFGDALVFYVEQPQSCAKKARDKNGLIVGSYVFGSAISFGAIEQASQQGDGCLVWQGLQHQTCPAAVIKNAEHEVWLILMVCHGGQVSGPGGVVIHEFWNAAFVGVAQGCNVIFALFDGVPDKGFAYSHGCVMVALILGIKAVRDFAAA